MVIDVSVISLNKYRLITGSLTLSYLPLTISCQQFSIIIHPPTLFALYPS